MAGFNYDFKQKMWYSRQNCWQYDFGYCDLYDYAAKHTGFSINNLTVEFKYNKTWFRIEFWKGRYGIYTGAEIGMYTRNIYLKKPKWFRAARTDNWLQMRMNLINKSNGKEIFHRKSITAWWITGFKLTKKKLYSNNLIQRSFITFKNSKMKNSFCAQFKRKRAGLSFIGTRTVPIIW